MFDHDYELEKSAHPENFGIDLSEEALEKEEEDDSDYTGYDQISQE